MLRLVSATSTVARAELLETLRTLGTASNTPPLHARKVIYDRETRVLKVDFNDGSSFRYPAELLRVESPSIESTHRSTVVAGRKFVGIMQLEPVGSYALRIKFDDLHQSGLYTWGYLHELGQNKYRRIKEYLRRLKADNLSRIPRSSRRRPASSVAPGG